MEETILVDGISVCYRVEGKGEALLLLHGMSFSHEVWNATIKAASKIYAVYALDLPGFGCSDKPDVEYSLSFYVDFLKKFLDTLKIEKCCIVGMSMGGEIAAALAAKYPGQVNRLVIVGAKGFSPLYKGLRAMPIFGQPACMAMFNSRGMLKRYFENMLYDRAVLNEYLVECEWKRMKDPSYRMSLSKNARYLSSVDPELPKCIGSVKARTLIIWGKEDSITPLKDAYKFKECVPGSELMVLDKCGHAPVLEKSDDFNKALLTFLGKVHLYYEAAGLKQ